MLQGYFPFAFDQGLMTAISWIANGIRERNFARKYLSFFIALEALFSPDDFDLRGNDRFEKTILPIEDAVAFMLKQNLSERLKTVHTMRGLKRIRNSIVHRGFMDVDKNVLIQLATYAWNCCNVAALRRNSFEKENSFRDYMLNLKYGGRNMPIESDNNSQQGGKPIGASRI